MSALGDTLYKYKISGAKFCKNNIKRNGRLSSIKERAYRKLERLVKRNSRDNVTDITSKNKFNDKREVSISKHTVQFNLHRHNYTRHIEQKKPVDESTL